LALFQSDHYKPSVNISMSSPKPDLLRQHDSLPSITFTFVHSTNDLNPRHCPPAIIKTGDAQLHLIVLLPPFDNVLFAFEYPNAGIFTNQVFDAWT
jgi:hypothetical protein